MAGIYKHSAAAAFAAACGLGCIGAQAGTTVMVQFAGQTRSYVLYQPVNYSASKTYPLMLVDHGELGSGKQMEATTHFDRIADAGGFIVAYPNSVGPLWVVNGANNDVLFHQAVVASVEATNRIDPARIYIAGYSDGALMADAYACSRPAGAAVAGLAIVASNLTGKVAMQCSLQPPIAYILFHGTADQSSLFGGTKYQASAAMTAGFWASHDACPHDPAFAVQPDELSNGVASTDHSELWSACTGGRTVTAYAIVGGGHTWPGAVRQIQNPVPSTGPVSLDLDASMLIWQSLSPFAASP